MSTLRDLLDLVPRPGHRIHHITNAIWVQVLTLAMIALHSPLGTVTMVVLAIIQLLFIHVSAVRRHRDLDADRDLREKALLAELAEANTDAVTGLPTRRVAIATTQPAHQLVAALARALHAPAAIAGETMPMRVSVGLFPTTGGDAHTALGCAEAAMRTAKQRRGFIEDYDPYRDGIPLPAGIRPRSAPATCGQQRRPSRDLEHHATPRGRDSSS